jgi:hypothetical protein
VEEDRGVTIYQAGTIGILLRCVRERMLAVAEANTLLAGMIAAGYRSP